PLVKGCDGCHHQVMPGRAVVVDDHEAFRASARRLLELIGYEQRRKIERDLYDGACSASSRWRLSFASPPSASSARISSLSSNMSSRLRSTNFRSPSTSCASWPGACIRPS